MRFVALLLLMLSCGAQAVVDTYAFESEEIRTRYYKFVDELRCPNCQSQNLAGSNSLVAADLRREVHRLLHEGRSDSQITEYMLQRYGDYILYRPRLNAQTAVLWFAPGLFIILGLIVVVLVLKRQRSTEAKDDEDLVAAEQLRLQRLLQTGSDDLPVESSDSANKPSPDAGKRNKINA